MLWSWCFRKAQKVANTKDERGGKKDGEEKGKGRKMRKKKKGEREIRKKGKERKQ